MASPQPENDDLLNVFLTGVPLIFESKAEVLDIVSPAQRSDKWHVLSDTKTANKKIGIKQKKKKKRRVGPFDTLVILTAGQRHLLCVKFIKKVDFRFIYYDTGWPTAKRLFLLIRCPNQVTGADVPCPRWPSCNATDRQKIVIRCVRLFCADLCPVRFGFRRPSETEEAILDWQFATVTLRLSLLYGFLTSYVIPLPEFTPFSPHT